MPEITLENVEPPVVSSIGPEAQEPENDEMPATVEEAFIGPSAQQAEQVPPDIEEELAMPQDVEPIVVKKPRGRPKGPPKPKPEPKKRGRPPIESNPEPRP